MMLGMETKIEFIRAAEIVWSNLIKRDLLLWPINIGDAYTGYVPEYALIRYPVQIVQSIGPHEAVVLGRSDRASMKAYINDTS